MIFMSQSGLLDRAGDDDWDRWYVEHLCAMVTAPGISSAQRFRTDTPGSPRSLAIYSVASPAVFEDPLYLSVRGFREWQPLIDRQYYRGNLLAGPDEMLDVAENRCLLVTDRELPEGAIPGSSSNGSRVSALTARRPTAVSPSVPPIECLLSIPPWPCIGQ